MRSPTNRSDGEEAAVEVIAFGEWLRTLQGDFDVLEARL